MADKAGSSAIARAVSECRPFASGQAAQVHQLTHRQLAARLALLRQRSRCNKAKRHGDHAGKKKLFHKGARRQEVGGVVSEGLAVISQPISCKIWSRCAGGKL